MHRHRGVSTAVHAALGCVIISLPLLLGQGCPGSNGVLIPVSGRLPGEGGDGVDGNVPPTFRFSSPLGDVQAEIGDTIIVTWVDSDPDNNATIAILLDPDDDPTNGNEFPIQTNISEDDTANSLSIQTGILNLITGSYRIVARITDGKNPELVVTAAGSLKLFEVGMMPSNVSPFLTVRLPRTNLSLSQDSEVTVNYCGNDRDDGEGNIVADVIILLDNDNNPINDIFAGLDPTSVDATVAIRDLCSAASPATPVAVNGGIVLGCTKDPKCIDPTVGTEFKFTIDTAKIPQRPGGDPYLVRVDMWDHTNPAVHAYAPGMLNITTLASGTVDLGRIGRQLAGTKFIGFDTGAQTGSTGTSLGDFDKDGADDFIIVARFGRPYERGNVGSAYMVYGTKGQRFGSEIYLNSFGTEYRGCGFASGHGMMTSLPNVTDGITSVSYIEDLTNDGKPELIFGLPYAEAMYDYHDDDPCDTGDNLCYNDGWPNPLSTPSPFGNDDIGRYDSRQGFINVGTPPVQVLCSNNADLSVIPPIAQGYMIYVTSNNTLEDRVIDLPLTGQHNPDGLGTEEGTAIGANSVPKGARLRGGYYTDMFPISDVGFGKFVASMPDLATSDVDPHKDGASEFLISIPGNAPTSPGGRIIMIWGQDLSAFGGQAVKSIPDIEKVGDCTRGSAIPADRNFYGAHPGDELGYASRAGDFNRDGHQDILCGAPGTRIGANDQAGLVYIIFGRLDFGENLYFGVVPMPRIEITGTQTGDRFGEVQTLMGDVNSDGFSDIAIASQYADGLGGIDCGYVGIVFGGRQLTGENKFSVSAIGTPQLPGAVFYGSQIGGHAGATIADAGDFNHDGYDDLLICAPREYLTVGEQTRRGVAYLVFGGPHLYNSFHLLNEVGTDSLPGIVFVSPYAASTGDEATIDWVGAAGDVDGDGFDDVLLGLSQADFVNPLEPGQRRIDSGEAYLVYGNNTGTNTLRQ